MVFHEGNISQKVSNTSFCHQADSTRSQIDFLEVPLAVFFARITNFALKSTQAFKIRATLNSDFLFLLEGDLVKNSTAPMRDITFRALAGLDSVAS